MSNKFKIFISSNQTEFKEEREAIKNMIFNEPFYKNNFEAFLFEDTSASAKTPENTYIDEVKDSNIYIGLIGDNYGTIQKKWIKCY